MQAEVYAYDFFEWTPSKNGLEGSKAVVTLPTGELVKIPFFYDGSDFRTRFMPQGPGRHTLSAGTQSVEFFVSNRISKGMLRAKSDYFVWSGPNEPFFWNSTTAYMLAGLREELAYEALDRFASEGINRIRVSLCPSRQPSGERWMEPQIVESDDFTFRYGPWVARNPAIWDSPDFDIGRFDFDYWAKYERILMHARKLEIIVQVIFFTDAQEAQNYPFSTDPEAELRYFDYAMARLGAFSNVEWCVTNEWALFKPNEWVEKIGKYIAENDPYGHLLSVHGHGHFPFKESSWCSHDIYQVWDEHGSHDWVLKTKGTRPIINEEFGYEDHYPSPWGEARVAPARSSESRARLAWEITMAGGWCTTGESSGGGFGGWINGYRPESSRLLQFHRHLRDFFASFDWWNTSSRDDLVTGHAYCRAQEGEVYAVYVFGGGCVLKFAEPGNFNVREFDPATGTWTVLVEGRPLTRDPTGGAGFVFPFVAFGETRAFLVQAV